MVISSFISSILILALGIWAYLRLESSMNIFAEKQLIIEPSRISYKMWKDMPVTMYQSFTFFNLTNWNQVKSVGQKPRFVEVGPYVYKTIWTKSDVNFLDEERLVNFAEKKQWHFDPKLSKGSEDDLIWTINTPLMTALALIQNAPVITRNIVSVILDGLGEGAFIKRNIRGLLFEGYSDLIVSVGPLFDRRFANFNGKFAYLYNKNDSIDGHWTVSTGSDDLANLNKIMRFQSNIVNMTSYSSGQLPQGLNEVKPECASAWSLDQSSNGQLFSPMSRDAEQLKLQLELQKLKARTSRSDPSGSPANSNPNSRPVNEFPPKRFFSRSSMGGNVNHANIDHQSDHLVPNPFLNQKPFEHPSSSKPSSQLKSQIQLSDMGKYIFYPDLCRPIHLLPSDQEHTNEAGIRASRYHIDPRVFMNSSQVATNKCFEMNPRPPLANTLAATINSVTGANVALPSLATGASSPFTMFSSPTNHHNEGGLFERSNPTSFLNNALHSLGAAATNNQDQQTSASNNAPVSRLGRVRQLFSNIVSQRVSAANPGSLLPSLAAGPASILIGNHFPGSTARNAPDEPAGLFSRASLARANPLLNHDTRRAHHDPMMAANLASGSNPIPIQSNPPVGGSDRWITQFRFKWPRGVFSIGQCQLGAPIYASLPHFLDADEYYLEQVDGLKPNRSLHEFYIDIESTLHSIPVGAKARLQLNVATPELRFRNIPNAMIPVLWQEVTFDIDKPVNRLLYWSFTMSGTLYRILSIVLLLVGAILMVYSFVGGFRERRMRSSSNKVDHHDDSLDNRSSTMSTHSRGQSEDQRLSWSRSHRSLHHHHHDQLRVCPSTTSSGSQSSVSKLHAHTNAHDISLVDELHHGAALNHAFSPCSSDTDDTPATRLASAVNNTARHNQFSSSNNCIAINGAGSPKQPSSRASSHCELVSSFAQVNCTGCLLACLRHSSSNNNNNNISANHNHIHDHHVVSDNSLVRQQQQQHLHTTSTPTTGDIDKATMSSRRSNHSDDSYTRRGRTFGK